MRRRRPAATALSSRGLLAAVAAAAIGAALLSPVPPAAPLPAGAAPLAAGAAPLAAGASAPTVPTAPVIDEVALRADQVEVVTRDHEAAISAAQQRLGADQATQGRDQQTLAGDQQQAAADAQRVTEASNQLAADIGAHAAAVAAHRSAETALAADRRRLYGLAVVLYEGVPTPATPALPASPVLDPVANQTALEATQEAQYAQVMVVAATGAIDRHVSEDAAAVDSSARRQARLAAAVGRDGATLAADRQASANGAAAVAGARQALAAITGQVGGDQSAVASAEKALAQAVVALNGTLLQPPAAGDTSPSILGPSALTAKELAGWFNSSGYTDLTSVPIDQLAQWYIAEGNAEGVRGDVAFAQAVLETGGFSSPDAVGLNNYAGIGHCDTCPAGWPFPSPQMGVRGQIQLLRAYAQPGLTTAELAAPPAIPGVTPELQRVRGCCGTWQSLTGVWATDPIYGPVILNIYQQMLGAVLASPPPAAGA